METIFIFTITSLIVFLFSLLFVAVGEFFLSPVYRLEGDLSKSFRLGSNFFTGSAVFIMLYRQLDRVFANAGVSLILSTIVLVILSIKSKLFTMAFKKRIEYIKIKNVYAFLIYGVFGGIGLFCFFTKWLQVDVSQTATPFAIFGSLHSGRYAQIAEFIKIANRIPTLGQNYGQSLIASIPLFFGVNASYLSLSLWLVTSIFFLSFQVFGVLKIFNLSSWMLYLGFGIVMLGNPGLSITPLLVIDSGNPYFFSGYFDSIFSFGSFLLFLCLLKALCFSKVFKVQVDSEKCFLLPLFLGAAWCLSAPQNVIIGLILVASLGLLFRLIYRESFDQGWGKFSFMFAIGIILGVPAGGMLTPGSFRSILNLSGLMNVDGNGGGLQTSLLIPHHFFVNGTWLGIRELMPEAITTFWQLLHAASEIFTYNSFKVFWSFENSLMMSFRCIFYLIVSFVVGLGYALKDWRTKFSGGEQNKAMFYLFCSLVTFFVGFLIDFVFQVNGFKWELSRFLIPSMGISMIVLVVFLNQYLAYNRFKKLLMGVFALFICFPWSWVLIVNLNYGAETTFTRLVDMIHLTAYPDGTSPDNLIVKL